MPPKLNNNPDEGALVAVACLPEAELLIQGERYFKSADFAQSAACLSRYVDSNPDDHAGLYLLARVYYHQNANLDQAAVFLKKAVKLSPGNAPLYLDTLGQLYLHQGWASLAHEVFEEAVARDDKSDARLTLSLKYGLQLSRKKMEAVDVLPLNPRGRVVKKARPVYLIPSIILHILVFFSMNYLSNHDINIPIEREDFTFVDVQQEEPPQEETERQSGETEQADREQDQRPLPLEPEVKPARVSEMKQAQPAAPSQKVDTQAEKMAVKPRGADSGGRQSVGGKSAASINSGSHDAGKVAGPSGWEKSADIKSPMAGYSPSEAQFAPKSLGMNAGGARSGGATETALGGISDRAEPEAADSDAVYIGGGSKSSKGAASRKRRRTELSGGSGTDSIGGPVGGGEKSLAVGGIGRSGSLADVSPEMTPKRLNIAGGSGQSGRASGSPESLGSLERGQSDAARASGSATPGRQGSRGGNIMADGKARGSLGLPVASPGSGGAGGLGGGDRRGMNAETPGRKFAGDEPSFSGRRLGAGSGQPSAQGQQGASAGRPGERFASIDRSGPTATGAAGSGIKSYSQAPGSGGGSGSPGAGGKAVSKSLGGSGDSDDTGGGMLGRAADKISDFFGTGSDHGPKGPTGADLRRGKGLSGLVSTGGTGTGPGGTGKGRGASGVSSSPGGGGEKASGGYASTGLGRNGGGTSGNNVYGSKKVAGGALGTPGGTRDERYAQAGLGVADPSGADKRGGVSSGRLNARASVGPVVNITGPTSGKTEHVTQTITGSISDRRIRKATLSVNNDSRVVSVESGAFEAVVSLGKGRNVVSVTAFDADGNAGKDSVTLDYIEPGDNFPVEIVSPKDGQVFDVTEKSTCTVKGTIGDQEIRRAKLILNGNPMDIVVNRGYFEQKVALVQDINSILVEATSPDGSQTSRSRLVTVRTANVKPKDIMLILTWDKPHSDFDLHVYGPSGGHTSFKTPSTYESREAIPGAQLEQDAKGNFGPEVFTQDRAERGIYTVKSNYFYSGGDGNAHALLTVILYGDNPSRRIVRVFGPHLQVDTKTGEDTWVITRIKMPEGIFLEE